MHASSLENMQKCYEQFVGRSALLHKKSVRVVDIGGANVNGSYADIFSDAKFEYLAVDLEDNEGNEGTDIILEDPYQLPFEDGSVDIVISGQVFEHAEFFWKLFSEAARITSPAGLIFLIVPSAGPIHRFPVDCYRFYPDAMAALSQYAEIPLLECWHDDRGPWNDLVGIFSRDFEPVEAGTLPLPSNRFMDATAPAPLFEEGSTAEIEKTSGQESYMETLARIHRTLEPRSYLEIGVRTGKSLVLADCPAVGVDPAPDLASPLADHRNLHRITSDQFFDQHAGSALNENELDFTFIDGMHLFEFALRDFINIERRALPTTLVVIDDIYPSHPVQAERTRQSRVWTGDVWKLYHCLLHNRPDLLLIPLDTAPTGLLLIAGLDRNNRTLSTRYNPLVRQYQGMSLDGQEGLILQRRNAKAPDNTLVNALLLHLKAERERYPEGGRADQLTRQILQAFRH